MRLQRPSVYWVTNIHNDSLERKLRKYIVTCTKAGKVFKCTVSIYQSDDNFVNPKQSNIISLFRAESSILYNEVDCKVSSGSHDSQMLVFSNVLRTVNVVKLVLYLRIYLIYCFSDMFFEIGLLKPHMTVTNLIC